MAQRTGLEPATPGVTGRYSNRLNYRCAVCLLRDWCCWLLAKLPAKRLTVSLCNYFKYRYLKVLGEWWVMTGSNRRPSACKADALPAELITLCFAEAAKFTHLTNLSQ